MSFAALQTLPIARSLAQIADREDDVADVYLERIEEVGVVDDGVAGSLEVRREEGFAVRLTRGDRTWLAARDGFDGEQFARALRQAGRAQPMASYTVPQLELPPVHEPVSAPEVLAFGELVRRALKERLVAFPLVIETRRHDREMQVVGTRLVPDSERELFYSCRVRLPWGSYGSLLPELGETAAEEVADSLVASFRGHRAPRPEAGEWSVVLGPAATAVFLHEAVAHALETDTLALGGPPEAAIGVQLGSTELNVLDDPGGAPEPVRRTTDDEGMPVMRRWLLHQGRVRQPLADLFAARTSSDLTPGAGRRSNRFSPPVPRSTHLELLAGSHSLAELLALCDGGLYLPEAVRGSLDPHTGAFRLSLPYGQRIRSGRVDEIVGPVELRGRVAELLGAVVGVGVEARAAGAGWCAKGGQRVPVWATAPAVALENVEVIA